jgi:hypothetical protein
MALTESLYLDGSPATYVYRQKKIKDLRVGSTRKGTKNWDQILEIEFVTEELPPEVLVHGVVVADEDVPADGLAPGQRLRRRQRLEPLVRRCRVVVVVLALLLLLAVLPLLVVAVAVAVVRRPPRRLVEVALHLPAVASVGGAVVVTVAPHLVQREAAAVVVVALGISTGGGEVAVAIVVVESVVLTCAEGELAGSDEPRPAAGLVEVDVLGGGGGEGGVVRGRAEESGVAAVGGRPDGVAEGERGRLQAQLVAELPELAVVTLHVRLCLGRTAQSPLPRTYCPVSSASSFLPSLPPGLGVPCAAAWGCEERERERSCWASGTGEDVWLLLSVERLIKGW